MSTLTLGMTLRMIWGCPLLERRLTKVSETVKLQHLNKLNSSYRVSPGQWQYQLPRTRESNWVPLNLERDIDRLVPSASAQLAELRNDVSTLRSFTLYTFMYMYLVFMHAYVSGKCDRRRYDLQTQLYVTVPASWKQNPLHPDQQVRMYCRSVSSVSPISTSAFSGQT